jgi:hypothetical protein
MPIDGLRRRAAAYVDAFMQGIRWDGANQAYERL